MDVIEELKLDLELSGKADIGGAYAPGDIYKFFAGLKSILNGTQSEIFLIDPYFNGEAFNNYLSGISPKIQIRILTKKCLQDIKPYIENHLLQFNSNISLKKSG